MSEAYLAIDQFGTKTIIDNIKYKTLRETFYCGRIQKMYIDTKGGKSKQSGFVLGQGHNSEPLWLTVLKLSDAFLKGVN